MFNAFKLMAKLTLDNKDYKDKLKDSKEETSKFSAFTVAKGQLIADGIKVGLRAVANLAKMSIQGYAQYEQLVGGVETLFGAGGDSLEEYAKRTQQTVAEAEGEYNKLLKAQETVFKNSKNAFKDAGMSANQYMEMAVGFSASLIQSLDGDTQKAAALSDIAMKDMSDNANKMGTNLESLRYAYTGFSRGQFMMLDNLRLGYGGTKAEMERLIQDANRVKEANGEMADLSIDSFGDMIEAIHIIQGEMNITGTTQKEAQTTIEGSLKMLKASFGDLMVGIADDEADFEQLVDNFVESVVVAGENLLPRISIAVAGVGKLFESFATKLVPKIVKKLRQNTGKMAQTGVNLLLSLMQGLADTLPELIAAVPEIIISIAETLLKEENIAKIMEAGSEIVLALLQGIIDAWWQIEDWVGAKISELFDIEERERNRNKNDHKGSPHGNVTYDEWLEKNGSSANGMSYVPFDGFIAELHKGERVLTAEENKDYNNGNGKGITVIQNIYSKAQTAADLMEEAQYRQERAVIFNV